MSWRRAVRAMFDREALLRRAGLEERTPAGDFFTGLGLFSVGVLVGAGLGLLFAPKRGEDFRAMVGEAWRARGQPRTPDYAGVGGSETAPGSA